jgi:hypothetical protein
MLSRGPPSSRPPHCGRRAVGVEFATYLSWARRQRRHCGPRKPVDPCNGRRGFPLGWETCPTTGATVYFGSTVENIEAGGDALNVKLSTWQTLYPDTAVRSGKGSQYGRPRLGSCRDPPGLSGRIIVDRNFRTTSDRIYAAGDVVGPTLASIAMEQGRATVCHAFGIPFEGTGLRRIAAGEESRNESATRLSPNV